MSTALNLDQALEFIAHSRSELKDGKVVVLEGLQLDIKKICEDISALPQDEMAKYSSILGELAEQLKTLEKELREQRMQVQQDIFGLNRKQKALQSYQTVSHSHKKEDE